MARSHSPTGLPHLQRPRGPPSASGTGWASMEEGATWHQDETKPGWWNHLSSPWRDRHASRGGHRPRYLEEATHGLPPSHQESCPPEPPSDPGPSPGPTVTPSSLAPEPVCRSLPQAMPRLSSPVRHTWGPLSPLLFVAIRPGFCQQSAPSRSFPRPCPSLPCSYLRGRPRGLHVCCHGSVGLLQ